MLLRILALQMFHADGNLALLREGSESGICKKMASCRGIIGKRCKTVREEKTEQHKISNDSTRRPLGAWRSKEEVMEAEFEKKETNWSRGAAGA
ncbi:hypothetical protein HNY73_017105 [Argiope bruennichi]|uniref:Uncharacterized protein n=1 Tax=Argiope bruennichi TaxID=94029 RepID=A0A8T0EKR6_ARGBR|nr:hypothetical protein HNY73_017105 [Argiope bruennichi]